MGNGVAFLCGQDSGVNSAPQDQERAILGTGVGFVDRSDLVEQVPAGRHGLHFLPSRSPQEMIVCCVRIGQTGPLQRHPTRTRLPGTTAGHRQRPVGIRRDKTDFPQRTPKRQLKLEGGMHVRAEHPVTGQDQDTDDQREDRSLLTRYARLQENCRTSWCADKCRSGWFRQTAPQVLSPIPTRPHRIPGAAADLPGLWEAAAFPHPIVSPPLVAGPSCW